MKKIAFLLICSLFLFSCEYSTKNPEKVEENKKIETNSGKVEENNQENLQDCLEKSPLTEIKEKFSYWYFKNKNDKKCYYLGYFSEQFFLIDENYKKNIKIDFENNLKSGKVEKKEGETENYILKKSIEEGFTKKYNLLYNDPEKSINEIIKKYNFKERYNIKFPTIAIFDEKNIFERYLEKFKELNIILPKNPGIYPNNIWLFNGMNVEVKIKTQAEIYKNFKTPEYLKNLNGEAFYQDLYERQNNIKKKTLDDCLKEFEGKDFIFLHRNTCYAMGYYSEMQPISYFYLYSENQKYKPGEEENFREKYINLLDKDFEKDKKDFLEKYNLPEDYLVFNYYLYPDIIYKYTKTLIELGINDIPSYVLQNGNFSQNSENFLDERIQEIEKINKKLKNNKKIETKWLKKLKYHKLFDDIHWIFNDIGGFERWGYKSDRILEIEKEIGKEIQKELENL